MGTPNAEQIAAIEGFSDADFSRLVYEEGTCVPNLIVLHDGCHPMSCHYDIEGGPVIEETDTAWHLGNINKARRSIAIDVGTKELTEEQESKLVDYICQTMKKYDISLDNVVRHFDISQKECPVFYLDDDKWAALRKAIEKELD